MSKLGGKKHSLWSITKAWGSGSSYAHVFPFQFLQDICPQFSELSHKLQLVMVLQWWGFWFSCKFLSSHAWWVTFDKGQVRTAWVKRQVKVLFSEFVSSLHCTYIFFKKNYFQNLDYRESTTIHWFTLQMARMASAVTSLSQDAGASFRCPSNVAGSHVLGPSFIVLLR